MGETRATSTPAWQKVDFLGQDFLSEVNHNLVVKPGRRADGFAKGQLANKMCQRLAGPFFELSYFKNFVDSRNVIHAN